jgi:hypothetical protein
LLCSFASPLPSSSFTNSSCFGLKTSPTFFRVCAKNDPTVVKFFGYYRVVSGVTSILASSMFVINHYKGMSKDGTDCTHVTDRFLTKSGISQMRPALRFYGSRFKESTSSTFSSLYLANEIPTLFLGASPSHKQRTLAMYSRRFDYSLSAKISPLIAYVLASYLRKSSEK